MDAAKNVTIAQVQVWWGLGEPDWLQILSAWRFLIFGVVMLVVVLVFRRI